MIDELRKLHAGDLEFYSEYLDIVRFPSKSFHWLFRDYLRNKYVDDVPDVIVLVFVGNLVVARQLLNDIFPATPVVAVGLTEEDLSKSKVSQDLTGIVQRSDPGGTIELILRLQPEIKRILLIGGVAEVDRQVMARATLAARSFAGRVEFEVWDKRSMVDILQAVTVLSPRTAILFTRMFRDGAGRAVNSSQAVQAVAKVSNVPVYLMTDPGLGTGAVGGSVANIPALGKRAGQLTERILSGAMPNSLPLEILTNGVPIFDWRALQRWGISESRLPPDSIIRFRPPSMWEQYRWYIIGALVLFLLQAVLIAGLVFSRIRRRRVEAALQENQELMEMATSAGGLGLWARDLRSDDVWVNAMLRKLLGIGPNVPVRAADLLAPIHPEDRVRMIADVQRAQDTNALFAGEFRIQLPDGKERWILAKGGTVGVPNGVGVRRMGVLWDITERKKMENEMRESEENFRRLVETTTAVLWQADMESWTFTYVTPQAVKLLGYPLEQWYEKDFWISHIHPDDRQRAIDTCLTMSQSAEAFDFEYRMIRLSGEAVWVHDIVNCHQKAGEPFQLRGLMLDVTERKRSEQAIRESEERFRTVANAAPVMIWMTGTDKRCTFFNKGWLDFTGRTLEQEFGDGWTTGVQRDEIDRCRQIYADAFDARQEFTMEYRLRRNDGEYCWVLDHGVPRFEADGTFLGYIGTVIDISEVKRGEERFRLAVEASPNANVMVNEQGRIVLVNRQTEELFGYSRDELIGQSIEMLVPERFRGGQPAHRAGFFAAPQTRALGAGRDLFARRKDSSEFLVEIGSNPIHTQDGLFVLTVIVDISARKHAEEALEKERAFLRQVIDIDPNFIFAKDRDGRFTLVNQAVADAYGTTVEGLIGKTDADFNPNRDEVEYFHRMDLEVIDNLQERFVPEEHLTDARGEIRWLQTVKRPIGGKNGVADQVLGASTDITRRKLMEIELQRQREDLAHVTRVSLMGELTASLAHELNQPLTAILSNAQAAQRFLMNPAFNLDEVRDILKDIVEDNNRAAEIIRNIRALVRKEELTFARLDLPAVIRDVLSLVHGDADLRNVQVDYQPGNEVPSVRGDRIQLQQVLLNLLLNAFDAMKESRTDERWVSVRVHSEGMGLVEVSVRDGGIGLTNGNLDRIFEPFFTTKKEGLGMGLSISRSIVEAHGGHLWAENNQDRGATFHLVLPVFADAEKIPVNPT
ncbi:MAG: ABC transporter substrate binding protein [Candidatus Binatia bacterium]